MTIDLPSAIERARAAAQAAVRVREVLAGTEAEAARCRAMAVSELQAAGRDVELLDALLGEPVQTSAGAYWLARV